jgi:hypothetical protein
MVRVPMPGGFDNVVIEASADLTIEKVFPKIG